MRRASAIAMVLLLGACAQLPPRPALPDASAFAVATRGVLAERLAPVEARHAGKSGFRLVSTGTEAYAVRAHSARAAVSSLDIQTYIWHGDMTGKLMARHVLAAADRGVRVRILVDDLDARAKNDGFAALDVHENVEVRLFNPMASRKGMLGKAAEFGTRFRRLNHRMHNKSWIADNRIAVVGGRNLGDEYFDAHDGTNFIDLDFLMAGPVVRAASVTFDRFWNSPSNYPIAALLAEPATGVNLQRLRAVLETAAQDLQQSTYLQVLREDETVADLVSGETSLHWTPDWQFVSDAPDKIDLPRGKRSAVLQALRPAMVGAKTELGLISPYFVPGKRGTEQLVAVATRGARVRILTNSLAATDVAAVHGGYARYRRPLLRGGVQIWELKPTGANRGNFSLAGSSGSSLHTKAALVDDRTIFVGSYNLDPRSTSLNTEQGVLASHSALAAEMTRLFERELRGSRSWRVDLVDARLRWDDGRELLAGDPGSTMSERLLAWLTRILPLESQL